MTNEDSAKAAEKLYKLDDDGAEAVNSDDDDIVDDIEASIANEIAGLKDRKQVKKGKLFQSVRLDPPCGMYRSPSSYRSLVLTHL